MQAVPQVVPAKAPARHTAEVKAAAHQEPVLQEPARREPVLRPEAVVPIARAQARLGLVARTAEKVAQAAPRAGLADPTVVAAIAAAAAPIVVVAAAVAAVADADVPVPTNASNPRVTKTRPSKSKAKSPQCLPARCSG